VEKTIYLCIGEEVIPNYKMERRYIYRCQVFTYLGTKIDRSGIQNIDISHRITLACKAINALNLIWWNKHMTH
jgi:hypothetical protein